LKPKIKNPGKTETENPKSEKNQYPKILRTED